MGPGTKGMRKSYTAETQSVLSGIPDSGVAPLPKARANWTDPTMKDGKRPASVSAPDPAPAPAAPSATPAAPSATPAAPSATPAAPSSTSAAPSAKPKAKPQSKGSGLKAWAKKESDALWASKEREKLAVAKKQMAARNNDSVLSKAVGFVKKAPTVKGYDSYKRLMG